MPIATTGACTEREITAPVDECTPDGRLNPGAIGWSRRPLHRCNLIGRSGRKKRWDYWCVTSDDLAVALTYADVDYLGLANVWLLETATGRTIEKAIAVPFAPGFAQPDTVGGSDIAWDGMGLRLAMLERDEGTRLQASFTKRGIGPVEVDITVEDPPGHETLSVVIPWSDREFQFTSKHNTRPATGHVAIGDERIELSPATGAFGCLDYGRGIWPYRTVWNWGSASGVEGGRTIGLQLGGKWTDGTGATENALCIDGRLHKLSEDLIWDYDRADWMAPWRIRTPVSSRVDLVFTPFYERATRANALVLATEVHQCFGHYSGTVVTDDGEAIEVTRVLGWAEEARSKW